MNRSRATGTPGSAKTTMLLLSAAIVSFSQTVFADGTESLVGQVIGGTVFSYALFSVLGGIAVYLVFKGTRSR